MAMRWLLASLLLGLASGAKILQLTDFHYDMNYAPTWPNGAKRGIYGDYCCDAPQKLVKLAIQKAHEALPQPDYLFWTGDNVPHIEHYDESYVITAIGSTTKWIDSIFNGAQVIPTFGNHDYAPSNAFPDQNNQIYSKTYDLWKHWIGDSAQETFLKGGYYKLTGRNNETFLVLNTNLYYVYNTAKFVDKDDPAGQFAFMEQNLKEAKEKDNVIHVIAHIAPGAFERTPNFTWMVPEYNKRFLDITVKYASTIKWMIFGHHHTDTFHVVKNEKLEPVQMMLMAPAVTPWFSDLDHAGSNNPAFRIFDYEPTRWTMNDVLTYYIDLDKLNQKGETSWQLEYSFRKDYGISSGVNAASMNGLLESMKKNETVFNKYLRYNSVQWKPEAAEGIYRRAQLCSIEFPDYPRYNDCLQESSSSYGLFSAFLVAVGFALTL